MSFGKEKRTILFTGYPAMGGALTFEAFKKVADAAKKAGFTHMDLGSAMVERATWQLDNNGRYREGYDFYPEYTAVFADPFKFHCPDPLKKHLPADRIARNGRELKRRAAYLAKIGLKGSLIGAFPQWLPESVYEEHPEWRGPRCDMPFRSRRAYFAPCVDREEVLDLFREASRALGHLAPCLDTLIFMTNDSGTGMCWNEDSYPGKNGPEFCRERPMTERVTGFLNVLESGLATKDPLAYNATQGFWCFSGKLSPHAGNMRREKIYFVRPPQDKPVAFENPISMLEELENAVSGNADVIVVNVEQTQLMMKEDGVYCRLFRKFRDTPTHGPTERILFLKELIAEINLDRGNHLLDAWQFLYRGVDDTSLRRLFYYSVFLYGCMSARFLVRPFVPMPELLTEEEKSYYKKYVFDSLDRTDFELDLLNIHGLRNEFMGRTLEEAERGVICWNSILSSLSMARSSLKLALKESSNAGKPYLEDSIRRVGALLCFAGNLRNCCRFQAMLDRAKNTGFSNLANSDRLENVMRDEIDNAQELIRLLEESAPAPLLPTASSPEEETTFLFGPDLVDQLRMKQKIMLRHWRDSQILFEFKNRFNQI